MNIKPRNDILNDVIHQAKRHPKGWTATFGKDYDAFSHDYYLFHPDIGIYLMKEYQKNPYEVKGIGAKLARHLDDDIVETLSTASSRFGIILGNIQKIIANINRGIPPQRILTSALDGKDLGIKIPVRGFASTSQDTFHALNIVFSSEQKNLETRMKKIISDDGVYSSYE